MFLNKTGCDGVCGMFHSGGGVRKKVVCVCVFVVGSTEGWVCVLCSMKVVGVCCVPSWEWWCVCVIFLSSLCMRIHSRGDHLEKQIPTHRRRTLGAQEWVGAAQLVELGGAYL